VVEHGLEFVDGWQRSRQAIDALDVKTVQIYGLDTLNHHHRNGQLVAVIQLLQGYSKDWLAERLQLDRGRLLRPLNLLLAMTRRMVGIPAQVLTHAGLLIGSTRRR
jgi:hypothetical protein